MYKYIIEAKYKDGSSYADKVDTLEEVGIILSSINAQDNYSSKDSVIHKNQLISAETIKIYTEDQETGELSL